MSSNFNELTNAQTERLAILIEELGEAQQIAGKILRHGFDSYNPNARPRLTNRNLLERELGDVMFGVGMLVNSRDVSEDEIDKAIVRKSVKIQQYLHHQDDVVFSPVSAARRRIRKK